MNGYSVSDLHLFASRSKGAKVFDELVKKGKESDYLVLIGDIFDFKWSNFPSIELAIEASKSWLINLINQVGESCKIYYIMGNHDGISPFDLTLDRLADEYSNFFWHISYVQLGETLFLHGDIPIRSEGKKLHLRSLVMNEKIKGQFMDKLYHLVTALRLLKLWRKTTNQNRKIPWISEAIDSHKELFNNEIKKVHFGHTHNRVDGFEYGGRKFYNSGTAIRSFRFEMLSFEV